MTPKVYTYDLKCNSGRFFLCILLYKKWERWSNDFLHKNDWYLQCPLWFCQRVFTFPLVLSVYWWLVCKDFSAKRKLFQMLGSIKMTLGWKCKYSWISEYSDQIVPILLQRKICIEIISETKRNPVISPRTQKFAQPLYAAHPNFAPGPPMPGVDRNGVPMHGSVPGKFEINAIFTLLKWIWLIQI